MDILKQREADIVQMLDKYINSLVQLDEEQSWLLDNIEEKSEFIIMKWMQRVDKIKKEIVNFSDGSRANLKNEVSVLQDQLSETRKQIDSGRNVPKTMIEWYNQNRIVEKPEILTKYEKYLDISDMVNKVSTFSLNGPSEITACKIEGPEYLFNLVTYKFVLRAVSKKGITVSPSFNPFVITWVAEPDLIPPSIVTKVVNGHVEMYMTARHAGIFRMIVTCAGVELTNSPHDFLIQSDQIDKLTISSPCWYSGAYNQDSEEFWIKGSYSSRHLTCFDRKGYKARSFELPMDTVFLFIDGEGNLIVDNGSGNICKYDKNFYQVWSCESISKHAAPVCGDGKFYYSLTHKHLYVYDAKDGKCIESNLLNREIEDIYSMTCFEDEIYVSDVFNIKVFDKTGVYKRRIGTKACALTVFDGAIFFCHFNETLWTRLVVLE